MNKRKEFLSGVPEVVKPFCSTIIMQNDRELCVDGCRGIIVYNDIEIMLKMKDYALIIDGTNLTMKNYYTDTVKVSGNIKNIRFERSSDI